MVFHAVTVNANIGEAAKVFPYRVCLIEPDTAGWALPCPLLHVSPQREEHLLVIVRLLTILLVLPGLALATATQSWISPGTAQSRPNFVTIVVDDLDSASVAQMPAVKRLLTEQGATFTQFFATTPLCCPSRVSMLRGQYAHNHRVLRNTGDDAGFTAFHNSGEESDTLATMLHDAGYATALIGKYLNGYVPINDPRIPVPRTYVPPGWDTWIAGVGHAAYANFDYTLNINGALVQYGN